MKLALVLTGGGACGRWQAGVLNYLYEVGIIPQISFICGTSVGGLNTLLTAKYNNNPEPLKNMWEGIKKNGDVFEGMLQFNNFWDVLGMLSQAFRTNKGQALLTPKGLYKIIDRELGAINLGGLSIPVKITTTDLNAGERYVFDSVKLPNHNAGVVAKATSAIPLAFPAVSFSPYLFVDGGLGRNNPVDLAIENGATHIILVGTSPDIYPRQEVTNNIPSIALRMSDIIMHIFEEEAWDEMDDYKEKQTLDATLPTIKFLDLYPSETTGSALNFANVEQYQKGYDFALINLPLEKINEFLK